MPIILLNKALNLDLHFGLRDDESKENSMFVKWYKYP